MQYKYLKYEVTDGVLMADTEQARAFECGESPILPGVDRGVRSG